MSRKRHREGRKTVHGDGAGGWSSFPWRSVELQLERDDGWGSTGADDEVLLYTLEEMSGSDYAVREGSVGGYKALSNVASGTPRGELGDSIKADGGTSMALEPNDSAEESLNSQRKSKARADTNMGVMGADRRGRGKGKSVEQGAPACGSSQATPAGDQSTRTNARKSDGGVGEGIARLTEEGSNVKQVATESVRDEIDTKKRSKRKKRRGQGKNVQAKKMEDGGAGSEEVVEETPSDMSAGTTSRSPDGVDDPTFVKAADMVKSTVSRFSSGGSNPRIDKRLKTRQPAKKSKRDTGNAMDSTAMDEAVDHGVTSADDAVSQAQEMGWELSVPGSEKMLPWTALGVDLHPALTWHLHRQGFYEPTPVQKRVLPKALLGRKDVIGAAETGSGKTLAYGLPLLSDILKRREADMAAIAESAENLDVKSIDSTGARKSSPIGAGGVVSAADGQKRDLRASSACDGLQALIVCPTRELALQVTKHLKAMVLGTGLYVVAVVGGLAEVKQERQLSKRPEVVVATPGRFWEFAGKHPHLARLETLRHLVIDEADRMLEQGHYPELERLFTLLEKADGENEAADGTDGTEDMIARGESNARRTSFGSMTSPFGSDDKSSFGADSRGRGSLSEDSSRQGVVESLEGKDASDKTRPSKTECEKEGRVRSPGYGCPGEVPQSQSLARRSFSRQTYVFSATLTLGSAGRQQAKLGSKRRRNGEKKIAGSAVSEDAVATMMARLGVRGEPVVIDMGKQTPNPAAKNEGMGIAVNDEDCRDNVIGGRETKVGTGAAMRPQLPSTLRLCSIKSLQMDKDVYTYLFCTMYRGRTLIFVNAIALARRLAALLCTLKVPATALHAQMQQRQRLKSLDRFTSDPKAVLVATDVAARGLDIPRVEHVVHYDVPRSTEVFIHRAGRTARARAPGLSLSVVAPRDDSNHRQICTVLGLLDDMELFPLDHRLVDRARERVGMALKVLTFEVQRSKVSASNNFVRGLTRDADLVADGQTLMDALDDEMGGEGSKGKMRGFGRKGGQQAARCAAEARAALQASLARPLYIDRRKMVPVAQALTEMKHAVIRTAGGDLVASRHLRGRRNGN